MIETHQLGKQFGTFQAVQNLTLTMQPGEVLALLGPNGAGKTTTVRMLSAILKPTSGWARIDGLDVVEQARQVRSRVGLLTEYPGLYNRMNALDYLQFFGSLLGMDTHASFQRTESLLKQFDLWEVRDKRLDSYSKGMRQKIALVRALVHNPPVLFLDEPTTAMDPQSARMVRDAIGELRAADRTILLTTHNLPEAEYLADRIAIIRHGQIIAAGTMKELMVQLLGDPLWEVRLATPTEPDHLSRLLTDLVTLEEVGKTYARYRCPEPHHLNPHILSRLNEHAHAVVSIAELTRSLEQVYLHIVSDKPTAKGQTLAQAITEWRDGTHHEEHAHGSPNGHRSPPRTTTETAEEETA